MKKWFKIEYLIFLTIFLLPVYLVRFSVGGVPTNLLECLEVAVFLAWMLSDYKKAFIWRSFFARYRAYLIASGLILIGLFLSTWVNGNWRVGLGIIKGWFVLPMLVFLVSAAVLTREKAKTAFQALYFSSAAVGVIALGYALFGQLTFDGRLQAFFNSPNFLAMYLASGLIIGSVLFSESKMALRALLLPIAASFYLTYSYAAWGAILAALIAVALVQNKMTKKVLICIGLIVVVALSFQGRMEKAHNLFSGTGRSSWSSRVMIWRAAEKITQDNWVLGIGPGNFQNKYLEYQKYFPPYLEWAVPQPHNLYLAFLLQSGLIGLVGFILLVYLWFRDSLRGVKDEVFLVSFGILVYFLIHGLVDTPYFKNDLAVIFWLCFLAIIKEPSRSSFEKESSL